MKLLKKNNKTQYLLQLSKLLIKSNLRNNKLKMNKIIVPLYKHFLNKPKNQKFKNNALMYKNIQMIKMKSLLQVKIRFK